MQVLNLPQDIYPPGTALPDDIIIHEYAALVHTFKGKSILHKNAISLVISGEKTMFFAEKTVQINDGEFHFLSAGNCLASVMLSEKQLFRSILVFFDDKVLADFFIKYAERIKAMKEKYPVANEPYVAFKKDSFVLNFISSLQLLLQSPGSISPEMKLLKFEELLLHLLEKYPARILSFQTAANRERGDIEIRRTVETNITNNVTLEELAFLCNMSLSTFKRRFIKIYGSPPNKWIWQKRMEIARDLLLHHQERPAEVYHKVGYENHSSFTQSFRKAFGVTPKEFQQQSHPLPLPRGELTVLP